VAAAALRVAGKVIACLFVQLFLLNMPCEAFEQATSLLLHGVCVTLS
jgi:hypothetical protein